MPTGWCRYLPAQSNVIVTHCLVQKPSLISLVKPGHDTLNFFIGILIYLTHGPMPPFGCAFTAVLSIAFQYWYTIKINRALGEGQL